MTVTKRIRFEILRRDQHTCQYCGSQAPDVILTVDHVVPVALGGGDDAGNLVAACRDCNAGKSSIQPDSPLVRQISDHAAAYALGMTDRMTRIRAQQQDLFVARDYFKSVWSGWHRVPSGKEILLPPAWKSSIDRWTRMGVPSELIADAVEIAMTKQGLHGDYPEFAYMSGVIWRRLEDQEVDYSLTEHTVAVWTDLEMRNRMEQAFNRGWDAGVEEARNHAS